MAKHKDSFSEKINRLFAQADWVAARALLERERVKYPESHWLLTQLGVTFYEERRYQDALKSFLASRALVADCPLTLWNLAGALDATGKYDEAIDLYTWLLKSKKSAREDPCWESEEWADALKTDCVYRLGVCFGHQRKKETAESCFRQYIDLLLSGVDATYSLEDAMREIRKLHPEGKHNAVGRELRKAIKMTFPGFVAQKGRAGASSNFAAGKTQGRLRVVDKH